MNLYENIKKILKESESDNTFTMTFIPHDKKSYGDEYWEGSIGLSEVKKRIKNSPNGEIKYKLDVDNYGSIPKYTFTFDKKYLDQVKNSYKALVDICDVTLNEFDKSIKESEDTIMDEGEPEIVTFTNNPFREIGPANLFINHWEYYDMEVPKWLKEELAKYDNKIIEIETGDHYPECFNNDECKIIREVPVNEYKELLTRAQVPSRGGKKFGEKIRRQILNKLPESEKCTKIKIKESNLAKYLGVTQSLTEKVNHANDDINAKILEALRSKYKAKKYADDFKKAGITVDDSPREGVTLIGPNGRRLSADRLEIQGPTKPGHNDTHGRGYYSRLKSKVQDLKNYDERIAKQKEDIENLKNTERDDIIRKYPDKTTEEALKAHEDNIAREEKDLQYNKRWRNDVQKDIEQEHNHREVGHNRDTDWRERSIDRKSSTADKIDYKGYLDSKDNNENKDYNSGGWRKPTPGQQVRQDLKNAKDRVSNTYYRWDAQDVARDRKIDAKAIEARKKEIEEEYKKKMDDEVNKMLERKSKADSSYKDHKEYYRKNVNDLNTFRKQHNLPTKDEDSFDDYLEKKANLN